MLYTISVHWMSQRHVVSRCSKLKFFLIFLKFYFRVSRDRTYVVLSILITAKKKDANHIMISKVICFFISVSKLLSFWYRYEKTYLRLFLLCNAAAIAPWKPKRYMSLVYCSHRLLLYYRQQPPVTRRVSWYPFKPPSPPPPPPPLRPPPIPPILLTEPCTLCGHTPRETHRMILNALRL